MKASTLSLALAVVTLICSITVDAVEVSGEPLSLGESDVNRFNIDDGGLMDNLLEVEEIFVGENEGPILSRSKRDIVSGDDFVTFGMELVGTLTQDQRTSNTQANTELKAEIELKLAAYLDTALPGYDFACKLDSTEDKTTGIKIGGELTFSSDEDTLTIKHISQSLLSLSWGFGLTIFQGSSNADTFKVQFPELAPQSKELKPAVCYLCQKYETCQEMANATWYCGLKDDRFYNFGLSQDDSTINKAADQTSVMVSIPSQFPVDGRLHSHLWISLHGTISLGPTKFDSVAVRNLPVPGFDVMAVYWHHNVKSALGQVYYHLYTKSTSNAPKDNAILFRANLDVKKYDGFDFDATNVLVVTWDRILSFHGQAENERVSCQAVIATDGTRTYLTYIYGEAALTLTERTGDPIKVGLGKGKHSKLDFDSNYYNFDAVPGNTGELGHWFFKIGEAPNFAGKCRRWYDEERAKNRRTTWALRCPCSFFTAWRSPWFIWAGFPCFQTRPSRWFEWGRKCCYRFPFFETSIPAAGYFQSVSPFRDYSRHVEQDLQPREWCCEKSDLCHLFYQVRPNLQCRQRRWRRSFMLGDPHVVTPDNFRYTFNNLGEFTVIEAIGQNTDGNTINATLQGRTCRAVDKDGNATRATVWCAIAMRTTEGAHLQVTALASPNGTSYLEIFGNGRDLTASFLSNENFTHDFGDVRMSRVEIGNLPLQISTTDGIGISVGIEDPIMEFSTELDITLAGLTKGIMGNFNEDADDDFIFPNGTVMASSASDRDIFKYVETWRVSDETSVFTYDDLLSSANFSDPTFVPIFLDEASAADRAAAEKVCNSSTDAACIYDFIATRDRKLALGTASALQTFDEDEEEDTNAAPELTGPTALHITANQTKTFSFNVTDENNDVIEVTLQGPDENTFKVVSNEGGNLDLQYVAPGVASDIVTPIVVVSDDKQLQTVTSLGVVFCSGCNSQGTCDFQNVREIHGPYSSTATCVCDAPYDGVDCDSDKDGCYGNPCPTMTQCTDVNATTEAATGEAFTCTECPAGYRQEGHFCADIDECQNTTCPDNSQCVNFIGSYKCQCDTGFRMESGICQDIDDCVYNNNNCEQLCVNTPGSYNCSCEDGYTLDTLGFNCIKDDVDPCMTDRGNCSYGCQVVNGSAQCICARGRELDTDMITCKDVNECLSDKLCAQTCTNTEGSYTCSCFPGYRLLDDKQTCEICPENLYGDSCGKQCSCRGRASSCHHVTGCVCREGWTGEQCELDIDECETPGICPEGLVCVNTVGSYACTCPVGFTKTDENTCSDINECDVLLNLNNCTQNCDNSPGSYYCYCHDGYIYNVDNNTCTDIDECAAGVSGCEQLCVNVQGSFNCKCNPGFVLNIDRATCEKEFDPCADLAHSCSFGCTVQDGAAVCFCEQNYKLDTDGSTCIDIDECATDNLCSDGCFNQVGGYECYCPEGKKLANDKRTCVVCDEYHWGKDCANTCECNPLGMKTCDPEFGCQCKGGWTGLKCTADVDECAGAENPCPARSTCVNIPGSYSCVCNPGYTMNDNSTCIDVDECDLNTCEQRCSNTEGSYFCFCHEGFRLSSANSCDDIDECSSSANDCKQVCHNTPGSFRCDCKLGFSLASDRVSCVANEDSVCDDSAQCAQLCTRVDAVNNCSCRPGFTVDAQNSSNCVDIDECQQSPCVMGNCQNNIGGFICTCDAGLYLLPDQTTCSACHHGFWGDGCSKTCECTTATSNGCNSVNGTCNCLPGWEGADCSTNIDECRAGAPCGANSTCVDDPGSYRCVCDTGFYRSKLGECDECDINLYGDGCLSECKCVMANTLDCHHVTGNCTCKPGWAGDRCELCTEPGKRNINGVCRGCDATSYGQNCAKTCTCDPANTQDCDDVNGKCTCKDGWTGPDCGRCSNPGFENVNGTCQPCDATSYGQDCAKTCSCVPANTEDCDDVTGVCRCAEPWVGDTCDTCPDVGFSGSLGVCQACDDTHYGGGCTNDCTCDMSNTLDCDNTNGTCYCKDGWAGPNCDQCASLGFGNVNGACKPCDATSYGQNCAKTCSCVPANTEDCDDVTGVCRCTEPWVGDTCAVCPVMGFIITNWGCQACDETHYGSRCTSECTCDLANTQDCDDVTGACTCEAGWTGRDCDQCSTPGYTNVNGTCVDHNECDNITDSTCSPLQDCTNTVGGHICTCKAGYAESGGTCVFNDAPATQTFLINIEIRMEIPRANRLILNKNSDEFRAAAHKFSTAFFERGKVVTGDRLKSVAITHFTSGSYVAHTQAVLGGSQTSEERASTVSALYTGLLYTDVDSVSSGASLLSLYAAQSQTVTVNNSQCEVFDRLHTCDDGFTCAVNGTVASCHAVPGESSDKNLIIGLAVGISLFLLVAITVAVLVCCYVKGRSKSHDDSASQGSGQRIFDTTLAHKWAASRDAPYGPMGYHESASSDSRSSRSGGSNYHRNVRRAGAQSVGSKSSKSGGGRRQSRAGPSQARDVQSFVPRGLGPSMGATPGPGVDPRRGAAIDDPNFSWEYMFRALEPMKGFEIQRPCVRPEAQRDGF